jgi:hypothetical protein
MALDHLQYQPVELVTGIAQHLDRVVNAGKFDFWGLRVGHRIGNQATGQ